MKRIFAPIWDSRNSSDPLIPAPEAAQPSTNSTLRSLFSKSDFPFIILFLAAFLFLFRGFFFQGGVIFERDSTLLEVPTRQLSTELLREGNFALWTDAHGNGQPFLANPKNAVCYPSTWLYLVLPFFTAFRFHYLFHVLLGWLGLYGLHKFFRMSRPAAFLGATLFSFSGLYLSSFEFYNHLAAFAWTPWILLVVFTDSFRGFKRTAALALLWTLQILAGTPEAVVITLLFAVGESFFLPGKVRKRISTVLAALVLGALIAAVQYIPSFELLGRTERTTIEPLQWPLDLIQLLNVPFPDVLGMDRGPGRGDFWAGHLFYKGAPLYYSFYIGFAGLLLFFLGLLKPMEKDRRGFRVIFIVFFLMANGRYFPLNEILVRIPILSSIRYPVKYMMGVMFVLALIAAAFFDDYFIKKRIEFPRIRRGLISMMGIAAGIFLLVPVIARLLADLFVIRDPQTLASVQHSLYTGLALLTVSILILGAKELTKIKAGIPAFLFALIAVADPLYHNRLINPVVPVSFFDSPAILHDLQTPATVYRQDILPDELRIRLGDGRKAQNYIRQSLFPFSGMNVGVRYVFNRDFYGLYPKDEQKLRQAGAAWTECQFLKYLRSLGCDYLLGPNPLKSVPADARTIEGFPFSLQKIGTNQSFPYLAHAAAIGTTPVEKWKLFSAEDFDPFRTVIVEHAVPGLKAAPSDASEDVSILQETQGRAAYQVRTATPAIVVFRGNWAPGWKARIDGQDTPIFKVNLGLKGIFIPEGSHSIEIRYLPSSFILGALISGLTLLVLFGIGIGPALRRKT